MADGPFQISRSSSSRFVRMAQDCLKVDSCCCGCSLAAGGSIIAWFQVIVAALLGVLMALALSFNLSNDSYDLDVEKQKETTLLCSIVIGYLIFVIFTQGFLYFGGFKKSPNLILVWIVLTIVDFAVTFAWEVWDLNEESIVEFLIFLCVDLLRFYFFVVVLNLRRSIINEKKSLERNQNILLAEKTDISIVEQRNGSGTN